MKVIFGLLGIFIFATACHVFWGIVTPGDSYPPGGAGGIFVLSFVVSSVLGFACGWFAMRNKALLVTTLILFLSAISFWLLVPDGWWASEFPPSTNKAMSNY